MSHRSNYKNQNPSSLMITSSGVTSTTTGSGKDSSIQREEILKIQQDCKILAQRIAELKGESVPNTDSSNPSSTSSSNSSFVNGIRMITENDRKFQTQKNSSMNHLKDEKLFAFEQLIEKMTEYERLLIMKTAPEPVTTSGIKVRRKSFGEDLKTIPTHLHLTDRLLDFHTQSKRVTIIKTTEKTGKNEENDTILNNQNEKKKINELQVMNEQLRKKFIESEEKIQHQQQEILQLKGVIEEQKKQLLEKEERQKLIPSPTPPPMTISNEELEKLRKEIKILKDENNKKDEMINSLHERLEVEICTVQRTLNFLLSKAAQINNESEGGEVVTIMTINNDDEESINLPDDMKNGINTLFKAIINRFNILKSELHLIMSVKDSLENDLNTIIIKKDLIEKDLLTISEEYSTLKIAYDSLSYETARSSEMISNMKDIQLLLSKSNSLNESYEKEINDLNNQLLHLKHSNELFYEIKEKLYNIENEKYELQNIIKSLKKELEQYKTLTEVLKEKVREMGRVGNTGDSREFLDTFEEVMREEMMTMKAAFETKLKLAKEEAEEASKRHHQEILRLQSKSPLTGVSLLRGDNNNNSSSSKLLTSAGATSIMGTSSKVTGIASDQTNQFDISNVSRKTTSDMLSGSFQHRL